MDYQCIICFHRISRKCCELLPNCCHQQWQLCIMLCYVSPGCIGSSKALQVYKPTSFGFHRWLLILNCHRLLQDVIGCFFYRLALACVTISLRALQLLLLPAYLDWFTFAVGVHATSQVLHLGLVFNDSSPSAASFKSFQDIVRILQQLWSPQAFICLCGGPLFTANTRVGYVLLTRLVLSDPVPWARFSWDGVCFPGVAVAKMARLFLSPLFSLSFFFFFQL
jgi:hypothetical protein